MSPSQRRRLLEQIPLERYTERTITDPVRLKRN
jgi:DNA-binding IclR family transcriptional regulator